MGKSNGISNNKQVKMGLVLSYATIAVGIITGLLYTPWMLSILGESEYGMYTIANSTISIFLLDFGLGTAVTRYMLKYIESDDVQAMESFYYTVNRLYLIIDIAIAVCVTVYILLIPTIYVALTAAEIGKLRMVFIILAAYSLISFAYIPSDGILTAHEQFIASKACTLCTKVLTVVLTALFLWLGYGLIALVVVHVACGLLSTVFKKLFISHHLKLHPVCRKESRISYRELGGFAGWITVIQIGNRLFISIIPTLLGVVSGSREVAIFGLAVTLESFVYSIANCANTVFFPRISKTYNSDSADKSNTLLLLVKIGKYETFVCGLIICGFISVGTPFIAIWTHAQYDTLFFTALLLIVPVCIEQIQGAVGLIMQVSGKLKEIALSQVAAGIVNIVLVLLVGGKYGAAGAAAALFVAKAGKLIYQGGVYYRIGKVNVLKFYAKVYVPFVIPFALSIASGFLFDYILKISNIWELALSSAVIVVIYAASCWCFILNNEERLLFASSLKKRLLHK